MRGNTSAAVPHALKGVTNKNNNNRKIYNLYSHFKLLDGTALVNLSYPILSWFIETVTITMGFFESTTTDPFITICWQGTSPPSDKHLVCSDDCYNTKYEKSRILPPHLREVVYQHGLHNIHGCKAQCPPPSPPVDHPRWYMNSLPFFRAIFLQTWQANSSVPIEVIWLMKLIVGTVTGSNEGRWRCLRRPDERWK